jgi:hypothetical protein
MKSSGNFYVLQYLLLGMIGQICVIVSYHMSVP